MIAKEESAGAAEGENYFVAKTDIMAGLLFIFIIALFIFILILMAFALGFRRTAGLQENAPKVAQEVAAKLDALQSEVHAQMAQLDRVQQDRRKLLQDIREQLAAEGLTVEIDETSGVLRLTEQSVRFAPDRADLDDRNRENAGKIARVLERVLPRYVNCRKAETLICEPAESAALETLFIEGHTETTGADADNWRLSAERAANTYRELIAVAPSLRSLRNNRNEEVISVSGYSSTRPIDPRPLREAWDRNRRIDLRFVMETDSRQNLNHILRLTDEMRGEINRLRATSRAAP
jgi:chemotaxis protein MotB